MNLLVVDDRRVGVGHGRTEDNVSDDQGIEEGRGLGTDSIERADNLGAQ